MFTTVKEERFRMIAKRLLEEDLVPGWFMEIEYVNWQGATKNLEFVSGTHPMDVLLVDDFEIYVHPGQESQWLKIDYFDSPYESTDDGLSKMLVILENLVSDRK